MLRARSESGVGGVGVVGADDARGIDAGAVGRGEGRAVNEDYGAVRVERVLGEGERGGEAEDAGADYEDGGGGHVGDGGEMGSR